LVINNCRTRFNQRERIRRIAAFNDPMLAVSAFKPNYYDLLVLNIRMPTMNGYELYEKNKRIDDKVNVCFLTGLVEQYSDEFKTRFTSFQSGSSSDDNDISFMRKPVSLDELMKK
jgi:two-component SAPR family response regulator